MVGIGWKSGNLPTLDDQRSVCRRMIHDISIRARRPPGSTRARRSIKVTIKADIEVQMQKRGFARALQGFSCLTSTASRGTSVIPACRGHASLD